MFKTEGSNRPDKCSAETFITSQPKRAREFASREEFGLYLDAQLAALVECFAEFETKDSVRGFFKRQ